MSPDRGQRASVARRLELGIAIDPGARRLDERSGLRRRQRQRPTRRVDEELSLPRRRRLPPRQPGPGSRDPLARRPRLRRRDHQPATTAPARSSASTPRSASANCCSSIASPWSLELYRLRRRRSGARRPVRSPTTPSRSDQHGPPCILPPARRPASPADRGRPSRRHRAGWSDPTAHPPAIDPPAIAVPPTDRTHAHAIDRSSSPSSLLVASLGRTAASPSLTRDPPARRPARDRGRGHPHRRPAGRRPGDPLLPAGDHDDQAHRWSTTTGQGEVQDRAPTAPLGLHDLRLRTATGISELRTLQRRGAEGRQPRSSRTTTSPSPSRSR